MHELKVMQLIDRIWDLIGEPLKPKKDLVHPLSEKLSFTKGLGLVIPNLETSVGCCKGGSLCQNNERTCYWKIVCVSMATPLRRNEQLNGTHHRDSPRQVSVQVGLR